MLQQRQIVKSLDNQINVEDPRRRKYAIIYFHSILWILIYVIVTIYRTVPLQKSYLDTAKLRSSV
jgi:hypothetical protein